MNQNKKEKKKKNRCHLTLKPFRELMWTVLWVWGGWTNSFVVQIGKADSAQSWGSQKRLFLVFLCVWRNRSDCGLFVSFSFSFFSFSFSFFLLLPCVLFLSFLIYFLFLSLNFYLLSSLSFIFLNSLTPCYSIYLSIIFFVDSYILSCIYNIIVRYV